MRIDYQNELNSSQYEAVTYIDGPSLIIAGAGSGKTRVLIYKIAYLLEQGFQPWNILALTFTNKAAKEMVDRIAQALERIHVDGIWCGTFHSIFARMLRVEAVKFGFTSNYTIYDTNDSERIIRRIVKDMSLDEKIYKSRKILERISYAKNHIILPLTYSSSPELLKYDKRVGLGELHHIYAKYMEVCKKSNALDFDDLLLYTYLVLYQYEDVRAKYQEKFKFILVDEYQDTNTLQYNIIKLLVNKSQKLCVVGDDSQSIYAFRGAEINNILNFTKDYSSAKIIKLEQNYRSTQMIVNAANSLIEKNHGRIPKVVYSNNEEGSPLQLLEAANEKDEVFKVLKKIKFYHESLGCPYQQMAVLYRTNAQSRNFEEIFRTAQIPYRVYGGLSFYQRKEVKDLLAYFSVICNPLDEEALLRIINYPTRGIGDTTLLKLRAATLETNNSLWGIIVSLPDYPTIKINKGTRSKIDAFVQKIQSLQSNLHVKSAYDLAKLVLSESGIIEDLKSLGMAESYDKIQNINELLNAIQEFTDTRREEGEENTYLDDYLPQVSLMTDVIENNEDAADAVSIMTMHAAKGLEFKVVFVTGLEQDLFPNSQARFDLKEMEEERRLFYVAITRACEKCILSYAKERTQYGQTTRNAKSSLISDIDDKYLVIDRADGNKFVFQSSEPQEISTFARKQKIKHTDLPIQEKSEMFKIRIGSIINHYRFGEGKIDKIEGEGNDTKATVSFMQGETKKLLLKYAKFDILKY